MNEHLQDAALLLERAESNESEDLAHWLGDPCARTQMVAIAQVHATLHLAEKVAELIAVVLAERER